MPRKVTIKVPSKKKQKKVIKAVAVKPNISFVHTDVPKENAFSAVDGKSLKNLLDLSRWLEESDDKAYEFHANAEKNDFSSWINDIMGKASLAEDIKELERKDAQIEILKHIVDELK